MYFCVVFWGNDLSMEIKTRAIVLRAVKYGEQKLIADLLTEEHGRLSFVVSISKSTKGKMKKQLFQPLTILYIRYDYRVRLNLQVLCEARVAIPFRDLQFDPLKLPISLFVADFLYHATRGEQCNVPLFSFVVDSVLWLDNARDGFSNFHIVFMTRLTAFLGFMPNTEDYRAGDIFDLREGAFSRLVPVHHDYLSADEASFLSVVLRLRYDTMALCAMSRSQRNRCTDAVVMYYRLHVPNFPEMKSLAVLRSLFS